MALLNYSPDFSADEAIWGWVRQEVAAKLAEGDGQGTRLAGVGRRLLTGSMELQYGHPGAAQRNDVSGGPGGRGPKASREITPPAPVVGTIPLIFIVGETL